MRSIIWADKNLALQDQKYTVPILNISTNAIVNFIDRYLHKFGVVILSNQRFETEEIPISP
jgi:lipoprotein signal peptidase